MFLQESLLEDVLHLDHKIEVRIAFPQAFAADYESYTAQPNYAIRFKDYLQVILEKPVELTVFLSQEEDGPEVRKKAELRKYAGSPEFEWRNDQTEIPILKTLEELLGLEHLNSRRLELNSTKLTEEFPEEDSIEESEED